MSRLSQLEIRNNAISFVHEWKGEKRERGESQSFWNDFLSIFGIKRRQVDLYRKYTELLAVMRKGNAKSSEKFKKNRII